MLLGCAKSGASRRGVCEVARLIVFKVNVFCHDERCVPISSLLSRSSMCGKRHWVRARRDRRNRMTTSPASSHSVLHLLPPPLSLPAKKGPQVDLGCWPLVRVNWPLPLCPPPSLFLYQGSKMRDLVIPATAV